MKAALLDLFLSFISFIGFIGFIGPFLSLLRMRSERRDEGSEVATQVDPRFQPSVVEQLLLTA